MGLLDGMSRTTLAPTLTLKDAVFELGGRTTSHPRPNWPTALIGTPDTIPAADAAVLRLTWEGWRGGVVPTRDGRHLADGEAFRSPALAAAACVGEVFAHHAATIRWLAAAPLDYPCGIRADWLAGDPSEPALAFLPSRLWLIGLGNLGQAFAWLLACLPYGDRSRVDVVLQDFDLLARKREYITLILQNRSWPTQVSAWCLNGWKPEDSAPWSKSVASRLDTTWTR